MQEGSLFSSLSSAFIVCRFFDDGHSHWCEVIPLWVLICITLIISDVEHISCVYWLSECLLWRSVCLGLLPAYWMGCFFFWYWAMGSAYILWRLIVCQLCGSQLFSPEFWGLSFHVVYCFLCLVAQTVKRLPAMWETRVWFLGQEDPLEKETAAHQAFPFLGFSRQEHWSGLPFPSPIHESKKWMWSHSVVSDS